MGKKLYPANTLRQAQSLLAAWEQIDPSLTVGPVSSAALRAELDFARALKEKISRLQIELLDLRNQRDDLCIGIWDMVKRADLASKAIMATIRRNMRLQEARARAIGSHKGENGRWN